MKDHIIRLELKETGFDSITGFSYATSHPTIPDSPTDALQPAASRSPSPADSFRLSFAWQEMVMEGWSGRSSYPASSVTFSYPESDDARVHAWFTGNYAPVTQPASTTLTNNVTTAVRNLLNQYFDTAAGHDYFTSPFRLGWAFRLKDGSRRMSQATEMVIPNKRAPLAAILSHQFQDNSVTAGVAVTNMPKKLLYAPVSTISAEMDWGNITHIDIIATPQVSMIPSGMHVTGVSTVVEDGTRYQCFAYQRLSEEEIIGSASIQNDFRILASIPISDLTGDFPKPVPVTSGALSNWKLLPKFSNSTSSDDDSGDTPGSTGSTDMEEWEPWIDKITGAIDLGMPSERKWVRSVQACGCYDRHSLRIRLYGSRHRQNWRLIADGSHGWVGGLAMSGFRWFRVRITGEMRQGDFLDALIFRICKHRY